MKFLNIKTLIVFSVLAFSAMAHGQVAKYSPKVGEPYPDFVLPSIDDGKPIQLSDYRGKKVLLIHFASW